MIALDLVERVPTVHRETTGAEAARVVAEYRLNGLVVTDAAGLPLSVIPGSQLLGMILPSYLRDEPNLAHVFDEDTAEELCQQLNDTTIGELMDDERIHASTLPSVLPDDTMVEIAAAMVKGRLPLIAVRSMDGTYHGVVTMSRVLAAIATAAGQTSDLVRRRLEKDLLPPPEPR